jgi:hypothetical protein
MVLSLSLSLVCDNARSKEILPLFAAFSTTYVQAAPVTKILASRFTR